MTSSQDHNRYTKNGKMLPKKCKINIEKATRTINCFEKKFLSVLEQKSIQNRYKIDLKWIFLIWGTKMRRPAGLLGRFLGAKRPPRSDPSVLGGSWGLFGFLGGLRRAIQDVLDGSWGPLEHPKNHSRHRKSTHH